MRGRVIQGFFIGGAMRPTRGVVAAVPSHPAAVRLAGPPPPAFGGHGGAAQARQAPGHPATIPGVAQPRSGSFAIDPVQIGLARGGGTPLPKPVLAKMEAAFGADFSAVRVHIGPQASRIGAVAFTTGNDIYFTPGRYQPDSIQGQQLLGHELAHVVQQRQGRVRAPASGVAVVQDHALEAEADRLGTRAANFRPQLQPKRALAPVRGWAPERALQRSSRQRRATAAAKPKLTAGYTKKTTGSCGYLNCERQWRITQIDPAPGGLIIQKISRTLKVRLVTSLADMSASQLDTYVSTNNGSTANATETEYWEVFTVGADSTTAKPAVDSFGFCAMTNDGAVLNKTKGSITIVGEARFYQCDESTASTITTTYFTDTVNCANGLPSSTTDNISAIETLVGSANISDKITGTVSISWDSTPKVLAPSDPVDAGTYTFA